MTGRQWAMLVAFAGTASFTLLVFTSKRPNWDDVQPWVTLAGLLAFFGSAVCVFDSWLKALKKTEDKPTDEERRNW